MPQVNVTINGRDYRLACDEGQEQHLQKLAERLQKNVEALKGNVGEIGDNRLTVMAALMAEDRLDEASRRMSELESETLRLRSAQSKDSTRAAEAEDVLAEMLTGAAERIERLTASLGAGPA